MTDIRKLTESYVRAFDEKNLSAVAELMEENFFLTDPEVTELTPKASVLEYISVLFEENGPPFSFEADRILVDGNYSVIEFRLILGEAALKGIDIIEWEGKKMTSMRAHLTPQK